MKENVEVFRAAMDAINRGDAEALVALCHPEGLVQALRSPVEGAYEGREGARRFVVDNRENFASFRADYPDLHTLEDGRVLAIGRVYIRGRASEIETDVASAGIAVIRDGLLYRWWDYGDAEEARRAAGL
jgi:ketosteroid isomerase-like protein